MRRYSSADTAQGRDRVIEGNSTEVGNISCYDDRGAAATVVTDKRYISFVIGRRLRALPIQSASKSRNCPGTGDIVSQVARHVNASSWDGVEVDSPAVAEIDGDACLEEDNKSGIRVHLERRQGRMSMDESRWCMSNIYFTSR